MNSESSSFPGLTVQEARYSVRLKYVMFPIDFRDLRDALARNGYELALIRGSIPDRPIRISFSGEIARKGEVRISIDSSESEITVRGRSREETTTAFEQLSKIIETELGIDLHLNVWYYEFIAHYLLDTKKRPLEEIAKVTRGNPYFSNFSKVLGEEASLFAIRLSPRSKIPNQADWFDISIEPDVLNADFYHIGVVFRNPNRKNTEKFIKGLEKVLVELVNIIEGQE